MAKAGTPKKKKAKPKLSDKEQSERFKEAARELGVDESGASFEDAFKKIVRSDRHHPGK
jgi:hypothetical protein